MSKRSKPESEAESPSFEESLAELQSIVDALEDGELGLAESLAKYERGVAHLRNCYETLAAAEKKIELLTGFDAAGNPITQPFDDAATSTENQVSSRQRPSSPARSKKGMANDDLG
jgi:exodeoxyribonuclease VII small subunit